MSRQKCTGSRRRPGSPRCLPFACRPAPPAQAQDKTIELKLAHWVPASHPLQKGFEEWGQSVEKASGGTIKSKIYPSEQLGKAFDHYDMARDGIADMTYINPGYQPGRFPIIGAGELPFLMANAKGGILGARRLVSQIRRDRDEGRQVLPRLRARSGHVPFAHQEDRGAGRHQGHEDPAGAGHGRGLGDAARRHQWLLALLVHLDGSGAVVFLLTVPALLPLYQKVGIDRRVLACVVSLAAGVNFLPWTGPTIRASAALHIPAGTIFFPMMGVQAVGLVFVFVVAWFLGKREEKRLVRESGGALDVTEEGGRAQVKTPRHLYLNLLLTLLVLGTMLSGKVDPAVTFMVGTVIALTLNVPNLKAQQASWRRTLQRRF